MRRARKLLAGLTACFVLAGLFPASALADGATAKEEVVYINLDASGAVDTVDVVNIFQLAQPGRITDYGEYESVRNMTTTDPVEYDGRTVTIDAGAGRLYYEGRMKEPRSPWRIDIAYLLDGKQVTPEALAGASGALEIRISIQEDPLCRGGFFADHALQVSVTLDAGRCRDISAPGATEANVGGDKQLTYTVLPGQGADIALTAQVEDFAMEGIAMNGVSLALDVDVDSQGLQDKVSELTDAVAALDDGAQSLSGGMGELTDGAEKLQSGTGAVQSGAASLQSGADKLQSGVNTYQKGINDLAGQSKALKEGSAEVLAGIQAIREKLSDTGLAGNEGAADLAAASTEIKDGIDALAKGIGELTRNASALKDQLTGYQSLADGLYEAAKTLADNGTPNEGAEEAWNAAAGQLSSLNDTRSDLALLNQFILIRLGGLDTLAQQVEELQTGYEQFDGTIQSLTQLLADPAAMVGQLDGALGQLEDGMTKLDAGIGEYTDGVTQLKDGFGAISRGVGELSGGAGTLADGAAALSGGAEELSGGLAQAGEGAAALQEGTAAMREQTQGMDEKVQEEIDGLLGSVTGGSGEPVSFVSAEDDVTAVQFVIRTPAIEKPAPAEPEPSPEPDSSFWQKLTDLF